MDKAHKGKRAHRINPINAGHSLVFLHLLTWTYGLTSQTPRDFVDDCLVQSLRNLGCKVKRKSGPHWALADGNRLLLGHNRRLNVVYDAEVRVTKIVCS